MNNTISKESWKAILNVIFENAETPKKTPESIKDINDHNQIVMNNMKYLINSYIGSDIEIIDEFHKAIESNQYFTRHHEYTTFNLEHHKKWNNDRLYFNPEKFIEKSSEKLANMNKETFFEKQYYFFYNIEISKVKKKTILSIISESFDDGLESIFEKAANRKMSVLDDVLNFVGNKICQQAKINKDKKLVEIPQHFKEHVKNNFSTLVKDIGSLKPVFKSLEYFPKETLLEIFSENSKLLKSMKANNSFREWEEKFPYNIDEIIELKSPSKGRAHISGNKILYSETISVDLTKFIKIVNDNILMNNPYTLTKLEKKALNDYIFNFCEFIRDVGRLTANYSKNTDFTTNTQIDRMAFQKTLTKYDISYESSPNISIEDFVKFKSDVEYTKESISQILEFAEISPIAFRDAFIEIDSKKKTIDDRSHIDWFLERTQLAIQSAKTKDLIEDNITATGYETPGRINKI